VVEKQTFDVHYVVKNDQQEAEDDIARASLRVTAQKDRRNLRQQRMSHRITPIDGQRCKTKVSGGEVACNHSNEGHS
jgi:hypothetical protein